MVKIKYSACSLQAKSYRLKAYRGSTDIDTLPVPNFGLFFSESLVFGAPPVKFYDLAYYFV